jgi:hypothetical protein
MKFLTFTLLMLGTVVAAASVTDDEWDAFCSADATVKEMKSCYAAESICELYGFDTDRCKTARHSVVTQNDFKSANKKRK